jgi:protein arginine N-methyltransferase 5
MPQSSPTYILSPSPGTRHANGGPSAYLQYIRHITSQAPLNAHGQSDAPDYTAGYADYLQAPLQPLMDDLGSATYDVFERDPVKYRQYEEAIVLALGDLEEGARQ